MAPKKASLTAKTGTKALTQKPASKSAPSPTKPPVKKVVATAVTKKGAGGSKTAPTKKTSTSPTKGKAKGKENLAANQVDLHHLKRPFLSSCQSLFQSEAKGEFVVMVIGSDFNVNEN